MDNNTNTTTTTNAKWDDPYKNVRPSLILDFIRSFILTK